MTEICLRSREITRAVTYLRYPIHVEGEQVSGGASSKSTNSHCPILEQSQQSCVFRSGWWFYGMRLGLNLAPTAWRWPSM